MVGQGEIIKALSYPSDGYLYPIFDPGTELKTEVIQDKDDNALDIKYEVSDKCTKDTCQSESLKTAHYVWDNKNSAFVLDSKHSNINEKQIENLIPN